MLPFIENKALAAYIWLKDFRGERGQSTAEYVAVTAVAVGLAIAIVSILLGGPLQAAASTIGERIQSWANDIDGAGGGGT